MIEQFYLTPRWDPNRFYHFGGRVDLGVMAIKEYSIFPKLGLDMTSQMIGSNFSDQLPSPVRAKEECSGSQTT